MPNGVGDFIIKQPTFSAKNDDETGVTILGINKMSLYPNPTAQRLQIVLDNALLDKNVRLKVTTLTGQTLFETVVLDHNLSIPVGDWTAGTYVISLVSNGTTLQSAKVVVIK